MIAFVQLVYCANISFILKNDNIDYVTVFVGDDRVSQSVTTEIYNISALKYINLGKVKQNAEPSYDIISLYAYMLYESDIFEL